MNARHMMTTIDAAMLIGVAKQTLRVWRHEGKGPKFYRYSSKCIRYRRADVDAWIEAHRAGNGATDGATDDS